MNQMINPGDMAYYGDKRLFIIGMTYDEDQEQWIYEGIDADNYVRRVPQSRLRRA